MVILVGEGIACGHGHLFLVNEESHRVKCVVQMLYAVDKCEHGVSGGPCGSVEVTVSLKLVQGSVFFEHSRIHLDMAKAAVAWAT